MLPMTGVLANKRRSSQAPMAGDQFGITRVTLAEILFSAIWVTHFDMCNQIIIGYPKIGMQHAREKFGTT